MNRLLVPLVCALAVPVAAQNTGIALSNLVQDGFLEVPYAPEIVPQSGITIEAWITYDESTIPTGWRYPTLVRQGHSVGGSEDYFMRIEAGNSNSRTLRWKVITQSGAGFFASWTFAPGQLLTWTHVAGTYDGMQVALYVNGSLVGSAPANGEPIRDFVPSETLRIGTGSDVGAPMEVWNGEIDEVRLWPFARTEAEILQTMNYTLAGVPGRVSTWPLDGHTIDTSGLMHATVPGTVTYTPNPLTLTALAAVPASPAGASTPGCLGPLAMSIGSLPMAGNADFAPVCTQGPGNAPTFLGLAFGTAASPITVAGVDIWLHYPSTVLTLATTDGLGTARFTLPLPNWLPIGLNFGFQYGFVDPCGPQGVTTSDALLVPIL